MNAHHRQHVASTFRTIDRRLADIEAILLAVGAESPLSTYALDVGPMERQATAGYINRIREKMWSAMRQLEVSDAGRRRSAAWAIRTALLSAMIDLVNMEPHRMGGYGEVSAEFAPKLAAVCADLQRLFNALDAYLCRSHGEDLSQRLARLELLPATRDALATIESVITRQGLVELRPTLDMILSRLASPDYEIAFFGRVSSGKSSLLNYLLGSNVLPVGVLPVTAVVTRLRPAERAGLVVRFETSEPATVAIDQIAQFVTEEGNPDNRRRVVDVEVQLPSPRLQQGVTFIDTPGVGSLATFGAAQTKAYLPRCDLGVLLVDAGASLNQEDLAILEGFHDAAVPAMVLISKSDLLSDHDRHRVKHYVARHIRESLGCDLPVDLASTRDPDAGLTERWFEERILPLMRAHRTNLERSLRRKIANLGETAAAHLAAQVDRARAGVSATSHFDEATARRVMESADKHLETMSLKITEPSDKDLSERIVQIVVHVADEMVEHARRGERSDDDLRKRVLAQMVEEAESTRSQIEGLGRALAEAIGRLELAAGVMRTAPKTADTLVRTIADDAGDVSSDGDGRPTNDERVFVSTSTDAHETTIAEELYAPPRPLPQPDEARLNALPRVRCSRLLSVVPGVARWLIRRNVRRHGYWAIWSVLSDYRTKLRTWLTVELRRLSDAYDAHIAPIRIRLAASPCADSPPVAGTDGLLADLEQLRKLMGRPAALEGSQAPTTQLALRNGTRPGVSQEPAVPGGLEQPRTR